MNRKSILALLGIIVLAAATYWFFGMRAQGGTPPYRLAPIERGNLEASVSSTGKLSAVTTVQVGTQASGRIVEIHADFNDRVKKGELIARIDPTLQEQAVRDAQAGLERAHAQAEQAEREFERNRQLFERKVLTEIEFNTAKYGLDVARANVKSAEVTLDRARQNLRYTSIYAPIDGVVVERNVDVGQTVAASLSAPQLFLIANDLAQMQILASVDESDIGSIRVDQPVRFMVQAYPNESFTGTVKQVRLQSTTTENVVNYTVVVTVANPSGRLLPGMTATLDFLTGTATDALIVPNAALRFRPTEQMMAQARAELEAARAARGQGAQDGAASADAAGPAAGDGASPGRLRAREGGAAGRRAGSAGMLWYLDAAGKPKMARVQIGLTDGQRTEVKGRAIREGMQVIIGATQAAESGGSSNPFQPQAARGGFRRPGGF